MTHRLFGFVDGENLVLRFQDMVARGHRPKPDVVHEQDIYVWHPRITTEQYLDIVRISFYQTVVGDQRKLEEVCEAVMGIDFQFSAHEGEDGSGCLRPRIFKKERRSSKTKSVDINLTVDMLRHAADPRCDVLFLFSGDGDYLPLVEEVTRGGPQVWVAAFSHGLNKRLKHVADEFFDLDEIFFE